MMEPVHDVLPHGSGAAEDVEVSILTVGFGSQAFIRTCFDSVFAHHTGLAFEVLFVDNGGGETEAVVRRDYPQVRIVPSLGNVGFGAGNNMLAAQARGRFLLLLNPDTRFVDNGIERLLGFARANSAASIWGGQILNTDLQPDFVNAMRFPTIRTLWAEALGLEGLTGSREVVGPVAEARQVEVVCGGFLLIDRQAWQAAGGFDEGFFLYSEEVDLMYRLQRSGHHFLVTDDAKVIHATGGADELSPRRQMYKTTGLMHYIRKHWSAPKAVVGGFLIWVTAFRRFSMGLLLKHRSRRMAGFARAFRPIALAPWAWWRGYR